MFEKLWEFLREEKNQKALSLIGGTITAIAVSIWAVWQYYNPKLTTFPTIIQSAPTAKNGDNGIFLNISTTFRLTFTQKGK